MISLINWFVSLFKTRKKTVVIVVFGPQGSGKSVQVSRLARRLKMKIFGAGEVLRERATSDKELHQLIRTGVLVADETMKKIVEEFVTSHHSINGYIFDGYPRNLKQFDGVKTLADKYGWKVIGIFIKLSDQSAKRRLATRFQLINGRKIIREDDQPKIVQKRLDNFKKETLPLKERFISQYKLLEIDGEPPVDEVTAQINNALDRLTT